MGVKTLWTVVSGSGEMVDLKELQGKTVAIDLAGWIVQNNTCKGMHGVVRPYLRNLFFRTNALISLNIKPIFVMDGDAPELKKETLEARRKAETHSQTVEVKSLSRTRLKGLMNESQKILDSIGVPVSTFMIILLCFFTLSVCSFFQKLILVILGKFFNKRFFFIVLLYGEGQ